MCTLTFLPEAHGYVVGMNRDELNSRGLASAPVVHGLGSFKVIYPREQSGGTWIAANSKGNLLALLNLNEIPADNLPSKIKSRGDIIPAILQQDTPDKAERAVVEFGLLGFRPFRLVGIFPGLREIRQWKWDGRQFSSRWMEWARHHWFSSSRSDVQAEEKRGRACASTCREGIVDRLGWLRQLHASHLPEAGAFSICVHRRDAATVSYTEVECGREELRMRYVSGHPCRPTSAPAEITIERRGEHG